MEEQPVKEMQLYHTVEMMNSADYKERFKAEYYQLKIRYEKLNLFVAKYENGELDFKPSCSLDLLKSQLMSMLKYLAILDERASIENVKI